MLQKSKANAAYGKAEPSSQVGKDDLEKMMEKTLDEIR